MQKRYKFKIILLLFVLFCYNIPVNVQAGSVNSDNMPTWMKTAYFSTITFALGIWVLNKYFNDSKKQMTYTVKDSASFALKHLLSGDSLRRFKSLKTEEERQDFGTAYWKNYDPYPGDSLNEVQEEFNFRVRKANFLYSTGTEKGWRTDMGRIYILYGPPDETQHLPFQSDFFVHPYNMEYSDLELWLYDRSGYETHLPPVLKEVCGNRAFFLFARLSGKGRADQIYSSEMGEANQTALFNLD